MITDSEPKGWTGSLPPLGVYSERYFEKLADIDAIRKDIHAAQVDGNHDGAFRLRLTEGRLLDELHAITRDAIADGCFLFRAAIRNGDETLACVVVELIASELSKSFVTKERLEDTEEAIRVLATRGIA